MATTAQRVASLYRKAALRKIAGEDIPAWGGDGAADLAGSWRALLESTGYPKHEVVEAKIIESLSRPVESTQDISDLWVAVGAMLNYAGGAYDYDPHYVAVRVVEAAVSALERMMGSDSLQEFLTEWREPSATHGELIRYLEFLSNLVGAGRNTTLSRTDIDDVKRLLFTIVDGHLYGVPGMMTLGPKFAT